MKTYRHIMCVVVLLLGSVLFAGAAEMRPSGSVNGTEGHALMRDLGERVVVLDVRTIEEFRAGHVPGALHIPVDELEKRLGEVPTDKPVFILCRTGRRAAVAYDILMKARPEMARSGLWYLNAAPAYKPDGSFEFR